MSNDIQKADQIAYRFYGKLILVVHHARATAEPPSNSTNTKVDKWFNLETPEADVYKEHTRLYKSISSTPPPSFELQVLLCVPEMTNNQVLVYHAPDSSRLRVDPTPKRILLESWSIAFSPHAVPQQYGEDRGDVAPATIYKHGITLFRSVFTLLRILPTWKLARRLRRGIRTSRNGNFRIEIRAQGAPYNTDTPERMLGFDTPPAPGAPLLSTVSQAFPPVPHPMGNLCLAVTYLTSPSFQLDELESLLSSGFLSQDEGRDFTPTLIKNKQRDSLSSSPGSLPTRTSLPHSPPMSIADRFVLSPTVNTRTTPFPPFGSGSPRTQNIAFPMGRRPSITGPGTSATAGSTSGVSDASSSRQGASVGSRDDGSALARLRRESFGGHSNDLSSGAGPLPIRRPTHPINPFKSSTLSSGSPSLNSGPPSFRQHSPLSTAGGPSLPARPVPNSPTSSRTPALPSPIGSRGSPSFRPSPTFAPSSLGDKRTPLDAMPPPCSAEEASLRQRSGKRYSSSFGYRFVTTGGAGSDGSASSGPKDGERVASASYLSTNTDDDDISAFVQDIDARKPLGGVRGSGGRTQDVPIGLGLQTAPATHELQDIRSRSRTLSAPMLTTKAAVDERLQEMQNKFFESLQGLGSPTRRRAQRRESRRESTEDPSTIRAGSRPTHGPLDPILTSHGLDGLQGIERYVRPRFPSTASANSIGVLGSMDPEIEDGDRLGGEQ